MSGLFIGGPIGMWRQATDSVEISIEHIDSPPTSAKPKAAHRSGSVTVRLGLGRLGRPKSGCPETDMLMVLRCSTLCRSV